MKPPPRSFARGGSRSSIGMACRRSGRSARSVLISVVTCVMSRCTGHLPATLSSSSRWAAEQRTGQRERRAQPVRALAFVGIVALDGHFDVLDRDLLAVGIPEHGQRLAGGERRIVQVVRRRAGVLAADRRAARRPQSDGRAPRRRGASSPVRSRVTVIVIDAPCRFPHRHIPLMIAAQAPCPVWPVVQQPAARRPDKA